MNQDKQRELSIECGANVHNNGAGFTHDELAAYTAAVEARERERIASKIKEQISYSDADDEIDICVGETLSTVVKQILELK